MWRGLSVLCVSFVLTALCSVRETAAQDAPAQDAPAQETPAQEAPQEQVKPTLTPPSVVRLQPLTLPEGLVVTEESVQLVVEIDVLGVGSVVECDASVQICDLATQVIADSQFKPATKDGTPIAARVSVRLRIEDSEPEPEPEPEPQPAQDDPLSPEGAVDVGNREPIGAPSKEALPEDDGGTFGASAEVVKVPGNPRRLELEEMRSIPGALGDPFRAIESLPGVLQARGGLPFIYVRGTPPAGTVYFYDDLPLPSLFHLGVGPAVIHPTMVGPIQLHSGVAPARYGRAIGGVIVGEGPKRIKKGDPIEGELELRILDVQGALRAPVGNGSISVAGRYGYPGLFFSLAVPDVDLAYWDYQTRFDQHFGKTSFEFVAIGSFDRFRAGDPDDDESTPDDTLTLQFHRFEARIRHKLHKGEFLAGLRGGFEQSGIGPFFELNMGTVAPRFHVALERGRWRLRFGGDLIARIGKVNDLIGALSAGGMELAGDYLQENGGLFIETAYSTDLVDLELGLRGDMWHALNQTELAADPRFRINVKPFDGFSVHAAVGMAHQPAVSPIPLPGLSQILVAPGLQSAVQAEVGVEWKNDDMSVSVQGFMHRMFDVLAADLVLTQSCPRSVPGCSELATRRDNIWSYGAEFFIRRDPKKALSGFISYTLARTTMDQREGAFVSTPNFDIRHNLNAVLQWQSQKGFFAGFRFQLRSGAPATAGFVVSPTGVVSRIEDRFPVFHRLDLSVGNVWDKKWGQLRLTFELVNTTFQSQANGLDCEVGIGCVVREDPVVWVPNVGVRASF